MKKEELFKALESLEGKKDNVTVAKLVSDDTTEAIFKVTFWKDQAKEPVKKAPKKADK